MGSGILFRDKLGLPFIIAGCGAHDYPRLVSMYESFFPEAVSQGLPPADDLRRCRWVERLLREGENFAAWRDDRVVGHCALLPDFRRLDGEYLIFVGQPHRNRGLGTALTGVALDAARRLGLRLVWLSVGSGNLPAIRLYRKCGFMFREPGLGERTMTIAV